ncbi:helix-turn-helix domain-containing protein [Pararhizobium mangrovi]|uniref:Helix-turn-helix transcriptional regulator n=1 Tax=Pararhizobium mangrovi TaxID=2590452 RepID=A0A506UAD4_9HYPH|nr:helix-turn-helix transcriptional regulator [Pararhizobium mangrovi]TPW29915.1 helix-turn-helix transcriptional regulator [Pararhizobium mangrovi]
MTTDHDPLPANLAYACSLFPSVAEVCRRLGVNRQQFNKYLSGQVRPSRHNMRRMCDFFGVTEWEMLMEEQRFAEILSVRTKPIPSATSNLEIRHIETLHANSANLDRYVGYYFRYFYAFGYPNRIIKSLGTIYERDRRFFWKNVEIMPSDIFGTAYSFTKYQGSVFYLGERIYVIEYEALLATSITSMTLYPSYHARLNHLTGVQTGGPTKRGRKPAASFVLLEFLGRSINRRQALKSCGLFEEDTIDPRIRTHIVNRMPENAHVFEAEQS